MIHTTVHKAIYLAIIVTIVAIVAMVVGAGLDGRFLFVVVIGFALITAALRSGRIFTYFWPDLLAGRDYLNQGDYQAAKAHFMRFLDDLQARPWLKKLIWLGTIGYSNDAEVLALNNLGAAEIHLGDIETAKTHLRRAIELDPQCPLPYRTMGLLTLQSGRYVEAKPWLDKARARGLSDRLVIMNAQRRNASRPLARTSAVFEPRPMTEGAVTGAYVIELLNDDRTPFEFVISTLEQMFSLTGAQAIRVALAVHKEGKAVCAAFDDEGAARAKAAELSELARAAGFPLACVVASKLEPFG